jgi:hypothetical protein
MAYDHWSDGIRPGPLAPQYKNAPPRLFQHCNSSSSGQRQLSSSVTFQPRARAYKVSPAKPTLSPFKRPSTICCTSASRLLTTTSRDSRRLLKELTNGLRMLSVVAVGNSGQPLRIWPSQLAKYAPLEGQDGGKVRLTQAQVRDERFCDGVDLSQEGGQGGLQAPRLATGKLRRCESLG